MQILRLLGSSQYFAALENTQIPAMTNYSTEGMEIKKVFSVVLEITWNSCLCNQTGSVRPFFLNIIDYFSQVSNKGIKSHFAS